MKLTHERLLEVLSYDAVTGIFTARVSRGSRVMAGDPVGSICDGFYRGITIDWVKYDAHRLAWFYVTGEWPKTKIDHENGDKDDNRFVNLRKCSNPQNGWNRGKSKTNTTGWKGVVCHNGAWQVQIRVFGKKIYIGRYHDIREAAEESMFAQIKHHGEFARLE